MVFEADMKWLEPDARKEMDSALARFDRIDAVYAHNARPRGLPGHPVGRERRWYSSGIDALPHEGIAYVKQGVLDATFQYPTGGKEAIEMALKILAGEEVPKKVVLGSRLFSKDNVAAGGEPLE